MALTKNTKFTAANVALVPIGYLAYRFYQAAPAGSGNVVKGILTGICLYVLIAVVVVVRAMYRKASGDVIGQTAKESDALAFGMLGAGRLKNISLELEVSADELAGFKESGEVMLSPSRFAMPIRPGDTVELLAGEGSFVQHAAAKIFRIDGVQQQVLLKKL